METRQAHVDAQQQAEAMMQEERMKMQAPLQEERAKTQQQLQLQQHRERLA